MGPAFGLLVGLLAVCVLASFAGPWMPAFDSLAILLPYAAAGLLLIAILVGSAGRSLRLSAAMLGVIGLIPVVLFALPTRTGDGPALRLLQHNILYINDGRLFPDVIQGSDVATFQEVQSVWTALRTLPAPWVGLDCPEAVGIGTAVATRLTVLDRGCLSSGEAWVRVQSDLGPVTVLSLHLHWPWPAGGDRQMQQVASLVNEIERLATPLVIGGDFNQMPWSTAVARIADAADGKVTGGLRATFVKAGGAIRLPIDHVIIPEGWHARTTRGPRHLSDHHSVTARITAGG
ncbi:endonuclease/exonuclease/phosphatase family protein [Jannaschia sp. 2305UL9-9]|uniref:endonuclease/exonuclease/phosphatase family protein n=1 Tax=Jannaschia sp. 2305UL9-9 TaxID=3121638 RepID=UPI0035277F69